MDESLDRVTWPLARAAEALEALARHAGLAPCAVEPVSPDPAPVPGADIGPWIEAVAAALGIEAAPAHARYPGVEDLIARAAPALLEITLDSGPGLVALAGAGRKTVAMLAPDLALHRLPIESVRKAMCRGLEAPLEAQAERLLDQARVRASRRARARSLLLRERLNAARVDGCWLLRLAPGASLWQHLLRTGLCRHLLVFCGGLALQNLVYLLLGLSFQSIAAGNGALDSPGRLFVWVMSLLTLVPIQLAMSQAQGLLAIGVVAVLKQRLLAGSLELDSDQIVRQGAGQLLGRVHESEVVEVLSLSGGLLTLTSALQLLTAMAVLQAGLGGIAHALILLAWMALAGLLLWHYARHRSRWTEARLEMTHDLIERMVGHRTRLAQEAPGRWHVGEDSPLAHATGLARSMDASAVFLSTVITRGWLVLSVMILIPAALQAGLGGGRPTPNMADMEIGAHAAMGHAAAAGQGVLLAATLAGILLAQTGLQNLARGLRNLAQAAIAWKRVAPLAGAGARSKRASSPAALLAPRSTSEAGAAGASRLIEVRGLSFRHRSHGEPVLRACQLKIDTGDRLLLEGPSGAGKSTLAALLAGLRRPDKGLLLLRGLDRQTLGREGWRQRVALAPQFHENHVFTGTLAFNLLMGRRWPPRPEDLAAAGQVCHELGLGDLLNRMPAGMLQMVGESGWQLSHGERSRLYIARALLQEADLVVLDESFTALDPRSFQQAMQCVLRRAPALLVIAHP
jgi:ATP-binding cassette subfamily B protein